MRQQRVQGHAIITDPALPGRGEIEMDTFTCAHCGSIVFLHDQRTGAKIVEEGFCMPCFKRICAKCADDGRCIPFEKKLAEREARGDSRRSIFREMGR